MLNDIDHDLVFLQNCSSDMLHPLVTSLIYNAAGSERKGTKLTATSIYRQHAPNHHLYWKEIADQIIAHGGSLFLGRIIGKRCEYEKVLSYTAKKTKLDLIHNLTADIIEEQIFTQIFLSTIPNISLSDLQSISYIFGISQDIPDFHFFAKSLQNSKNSNESLYALIALIVAHGAGKYSCGSGYTAIFPKSICTTLEMFENPIRLHLQRMNINDTLRELVLPIILHLAFLRRSDLLNLKSLQGSVSVPDPNHPRWRDLVTGKRTYTLKYFAVKILLGRLMCRVAADPSERTIQESIVQLHAIYLKNSSSAAAQDDLWQIFHQ